MGLGRTTRFASTPRGAKRIPVMRLGTSGVKSLAPSLELLADFSQRKKKLISEGLDSQEAHARAFRETDYRERFVAEIRANPKAIEHLRDIVRQARAADIYLMCMCPYRTKEWACHTYILLDMAREMDVGLKLLDEPGPRPRKRAAGH